jgi:hypothetical protein
VWCSLMAGGVVPDVVESELELTLLPAGPLPGEFMATQCWQQQVAAAGAEVSVAARAQNPSGSVRHSTHRLRGGTLASSPLPTLTPCHISGGEKNDLVVVVGGSDPPLHRNAVGVVLPLEQVITSAA